MVPGDAAPGSRAAAVEAGRRRAKNEAGKRRGTLSLLGRDEATPWAPHRANQWVTWGQPSADNWPSLQDSPLRLLCTIDIFWPSVDTARMGPNLTFPHDIKTSRNKNWRDQHATKQNTHIPSVFLLSLILGFFFQSAPLRNREGCLDTEPRLGK